MPPSSDDVPDLADPSHNSVRAELARVILQHKADLGLFGRDDAELVARVDDVVVFLLERYGRALLAGDSAWLRRYAWFVEACGRLYREDAATTLDS